MINLHFTSKQVPTYRKTCLLLVNSIHLVLSSLEIQRTITQTKYTTSFVTLSEKKRLANLQKQQLQKTFSQVYKLLLLLASMNVSYSM